MTAARAESPSSPSPRRALIVSHGQPSDPGPAEAALTHFAAQVVARLPANWSVEAATLAAPGALKAALARSAGCDGPLLIYPMFIADGWFTQINLPARIRAAGIAVLAPSPGGAPGSEGGSDAEPMVAAAPVAGHAAPGILPHLPAPARVSTGGAAQILPPFGLDPGILPLALRALRRALDDGGLRAADTGLMVAAHGSFKSRAPAMVARRLARAIIAELPFAEMRTAFIDQAPQIAASARGLPVPALCLPLFAAAGGHVEEDLPAALAEAGFTGRILAPLGLAPDAPDLVAGALLATSVESGGR